MPRGPKGEKRPADVIVPLRRPKFGALLLHRGRLLTLAR